MAKAPKTPAKPNAGANQRKQKADASAIVQRAVAQRAQATGPASRAAAAAPVSSGMAALGALKKNANAAGVSQKEQTAIGNRSSGLGQMAGNMKRATAAANGNRPTVGGSDGRNGVKGGIPGRPVDRRAAARKAAATRKARGK